MVSCHFILGFIFLKVDYGESPFLAHYSFLFQVGTYTLYNIQLVVMSIDSCFSSSLLFILLSI